MVRTRPHTEAAASEAAARAILQGRLRAAAEPALLTGARPGTADMALLADLAAGLPLVLSCPSTHLTKSWIKLLVSPSWSRRLCKSW